MAKYSQAFKQQAVDFYFAHQQPRNFTAQLFKIPSVHVTRRVKRFQTHGQDGLIVRHGKRNHSLEFKKHVIYTMLSEQLSQEMTALRFNLYSSNISQWLKMFISYRIKNLLPQPSHPSTMKTKYPQMPPPPQTEEERLRLRIL